MNLALNSATALAVGEQSGNEHVLVEAVRRAGRQPAGRLAVVLRLSRLAAPAPRPHHRRIARAILQDVAQRYEGQVFVPRNGDLVLLCRARAVPAGDRPGASLSCDPASLPGVLQRLLARDVPDAREVVSVWPLETSLPQVIAYAQACVDGTAASVPPTYEAAWAPRDVEAVAALVETGGVHNLTRRQTAVQLNADQRGNAAGRAPAGPLLRPLYREVSFSIAALEARIRAGGQAGSDPFLFRHLAGRLDRRMLDMLCHEAGTGRPLDLAAHGDLSEGGSSPLHLNLTVGAVLSDSFARLAQVCGDFSAALGVEIALMEACADIDAFAQARAVVRAAGMSLVLDDVSHLTLLLARPEVLDPDLMKLDWSPRMAELGQPETRQLEVALETIGADRVVLAHAGTEAAIRWGLQHGIRRFQGRHVDAMLGASRIVACAASAGCTLRQCVERASATGAAGRVGCANPALLDGAAPNGAPSRRHAVRPARVAVAPMVQLGMVAS